MNIVKAIIIVIGVISIITPILWIFILYFIKKKQTHNVYSENLPLKELIIIN